MTDDPYSSVPKPPSYAGPRATDQFAAQRLAGDRPMGTQKQYLESSVNNSPLSQLERNNLQLVNFKYPLNLGTDSIYRHIMRIFIFKQNRSTFPQATVAGGSYDFTKSAGASAPKTVSFTGGAGAAITAKEAGNVLGGK